MAQLDIAFSYDSLYFEAFQRLRQIMPLLLVNGNGKEQILAGGVFGSKAHHFPSDGKVELAVGLKKEHVCRLTMIKVIDMHAVQ